MKPLYFAVAFLVTLSFLSISDAMAHQEAAVRVSMETGYVLNTFMFLVCGVLVMWMAAGFTMLEAGLVRTKNTTAICLKNVVLYAIAGILYYLIGYNLMYTGVPEGGWIGSFSLFTNPGTAEAALIAADAESEFAISRATGTVLEESSYSQMSDWFFQMVFVATAASIVSGTIAERMKLLPFLIFVVILTGLIYPVQGAWSWGGGWLAEMGFSDFAGSTIVHSVGGWAALTGAIILGPRYDKYTPDGAVKALPGANLPLATLGTLILWMGWFGFNGGSVLALDSAQAASSMALVFANTNLAAAAGAVAAMIYALLRFGKPDLTIVLNGAISGLVAITAGPDIGHPGLAIVIGGIGGLLCSIAIPLWDRFKIDDVVGALSAHLVAGIWGTLAVAIFGGDFANQIVPQIVGILAVGAYVCITSAIVWLALKYTIGLRLEEREERNGIDRTEIGMEAYPEFNSRAG